MIELLQEIEIETRGDIESLVKSAQAKNIKITYPLKLNLELEGNKVFILEKSQNILFRTYEYQ